MGRRKIEIQPILEDRNRSVTFLKRKNGLFKKAYELGVLCGAEVALIVFSGNGKLYEFSSGDLNATLLRYSSHDGQPYEHRSPRDYEHVKSTTGQASNAPPVDDDEDFSDDLDLDENERKPKRNSPGKAGFKVSNLATTMPWSSAFAAPGSLPSWPYHDAASSSGPPTSIGKLNHLLHSPSPSLVSFADIPGSPEPSPRAFSFSHCYPTPAGGLNQTHTITMAMLPIPSFNSDSTSILHASEFSANRQLPATEAASGISNNYMLRHPPYIESSWPVRSSSVLLPESASSACQTPALDEADQAMGLSEITDLTFSSLTSPVRAGTVGSGTYPPMTPNSFSCMPSNSGNSTTASRSAHRFSSSISYYRSHKEAYRFHSMGAESVESDDQHGHTKGRVSEPPGQPLYSQKVSCSGSGIPSSHANEGSAGYASQSGAMVSTTNSFLSGFPFDPKSMSVNGTPVGSNHPFQWPCTSTSGETSVPADAIEMQWSNSRSHSPCLVQNPLLP